MFGRFDRTAFSGTCTKDHHDEKGWHDSDAKGFSRTEYVILFDLLQT